MRRALRALTACAILAACGSLMAASNQELLKSVPQNSGIAVAADLGKLLELPIVKTAREKDPELERQFSELETKLAAKKLTIKDMVSNFVAFSDDASQLGGVLISTNLGEANLEALLKGEIFEAPSSEYSVETIQGRKTYILRGAKSPIVPGKDSIPGGIAGKQIAEILKQDPGKAVAVTFLASDVLLAIDRDAYEKYLAAPKGLNQATAARAATIDMEAPLWCVFAMPKKTLTQVNNPAPNAFADKIAGVALSLNVKPLSQDALAIKACLECVDAPSAAMTCQQIQGIVMMMSLSGGQGGQQSPMAEILNSLILDNKDKFITIDLTLTKRMLDSLGKQGKALAPQLGGAPRQPSSAP